MSIVLNEIAWAEKMIEESSLGDNAYETLCRVAKYYKYSGMKKSDVRKSLEKFLQRCDPYASLVLWSDTLDKAVKVGMKYNPVMVDCIVITKPEMDSILTLNGTYKRNTQLQRLAFTLLCVAKYMMIVAPQTSGWVNTPESDIMKMANIKTPYKRQNLLYGQLLDAGLIRPSKKINNLNVQVQFMQDGDTAVEVRDFRDLGNQFMRYIGKPYFICQNCGLTVKVPDGAKLGKMKYCPDCAVRIKAQQNINAVMRGRHTGMTADF